MILNGKKSEEGTKALKSGQRYKVKNLFGEWVEGVWLTEGEKAVFFSDDSRFLHRNHVNEVMDVFRFGNVHCSQCGKGFGPGDNGFSHCADHKAFAEKEMCLSVR